MEFIRIEGAYILGKILFYIDMSVLGEQCFDEMFCLIGKF